MLRSGADGLAQTVGGGCGLEVERAMHGSNIVAASAWETSEGHAAERQKDLKQVGGEGMGNPQEIPRLPRDIQDFRGVMRGDESLTSLAVYFCNWHMFREYMDNIPC